MQDINGEKGSLWMVLNPTGQMPISFTLTQRKETGIEAARSLIASCKYLGNDLDQERTELRRARIRQAKTMEEISSIVDEIPNLSGEPGQERQNPPD